MRVKDIILIGVFLFLAAPMFAATPRRREDEEPTPGGSLLPRGIRNNNPGNLKISGNDWIGKIDIRYNTDGVFEQFESMEMGVRAAILTLVSYIERRNLDTIRGIIGRWAPSSENQTGAYIEYVSRCSGVHPDRPLGVDKAILSKVLRCMFVLENGERYSNLIPTEREIIQTWNNYI